MPTRSDREPSGPLENTIDAYLAGSTVGSSAKATILSVGHMSILPGLP
jgi:hypothetical protein